jgi:1-acyl-sn-glycerol-3-phosphate acyltransferase
MELSLPASTFSQALALAALRLKSWKLNVTLPTSQKFVLVGAPHTSNWDLLSALLIKYGAGLNMHWIGKDSAFRWPVGGVMRRLGGIPVNRRSSNNFVNQIVEVFNRMENLVVAIAPEGTRSKTGYWKTGFYYIALGARVPIALGYVDYGQKTVGIGPSFMPTGDIQADFQHIKNFYGGMKGKYPKLQGEIRLRPEE